MEDYVQTDFDELEETLADPKYQEKWKMTPYFSDIVRLIALKMDKEVGKSVVDRLNNTLKITTIKSFGKSSIKSDIARKEQETQAENKDVVYGDEVGGLTYTSWGLYEARRIRINQFDDDINNYDLEDFFEEDNIEKELIDKTEKEKPKQKNQITNIKLKPEKMEEISKAFFEERNSSNCTKSMLIEMKSNFKNMSKHNFIKHGKKIVLTHELFHTIEQISKEKCGGVDRKLNRLFEGMTEWLARQVVLENPSYYLEKGQHDVCFVAYTPYVHYANILNTILPGGVAVYYLFGPQKFKDEKRQQMFDQMIEMFEPIQALFELENNKNNFSEEELKLKTKETQKRVVENFFEISKFVKTNLSRKERNQVFEDMFYCFKECCGFKYFAPDFEKGVLYDGKSKEAEKVKKIKELAYRNKNNIDKTKRQVVFEAKKRHAGIKRGLEKTKKAINDLDRLTEKKDETISR